MSKIPNYFHLPSQLVKILIIGRLTMVLLVFKLIIAKMKQ